MGLMRAFSSIALVCLFGTASAVKADDLMFCSDNNSAFSRNGAALYSAAQLVDITGPLNEVMGCTPTETTAALLIKRGTNVGGKGGAFLNYLNAGGVIITELFSGEIYNEIFGTNFTQSGIIGGCGDNVMPEVVLNPNDSFWQPLFNLETPTGNAVSCGGNLNDLVAGQSANVVPLGARVINGANQISLAYRKVGAGVMFLNNNDWQDPDVTWSDSSTTLMSAMIGGADRDGDGVFGLADAYPNDASKSAVVPQGVPTLPLVGLLALVGLLGLFGLRKLRQ